MVVSSRLREIDRLPPGIEQREAAGAVGRFHHAGLEAGLADGRRLLVAGDAANRDRARRRAPARSCRNRAAQSVTSGSMARGTSKIVEELVVEVARCGCRRAACARHWWRRWRAPCRRSAARSGSVSTVPKHEFAALGAFAGRRARCRAARRPWCRRNRGRGAARSAP